jgi:16S rRNA G966 N2-methylase RsmD
MCKCIVCCLCMYVWCGVQAMARCHRIGQTKPVTIYRLITRKSFEAEMFDRASRKLGLEQALLGSRQFEGEEGGSSDEIKMDAKEMEALLRQGAYAVLLDDDADVVKEFCEQDIDSILDQRSHVRVVEGKQTESWLNKKKKNSRATKSMFTGDTAMEHAEIDVNDPDFWKKVLPDLVTPEMMLLTLNDLSKKGKVLQMSRDQEEDDEDDEGEGAREGEEGLAAECGKYFADIAQMMEGILDLQRRY